MNKTEKTKILFEQRKVLKNLRTKFFLKMRPQYQWNRLDAAKIGIILAIREHLDFTQNTS